MSVIPITTTSVTVAIDPTKPVVNLTALR